MIKEVTIRLDASRKATPGEIQGLAARQAGITPDMINECRVVKRSVDARRNPVKLNLSVLLAWGDDKQLSAGYKSIEFKRLPESAPVIIIVGAGPAGLFAALRAIELGIRPIILERGKDVDARRLDLALISRKGIVDSDSNYCFGEGGAGAYSDGKLFTRSKKRGNVKDVLGLLYQFGAREDVMTDAHPHIGSDKLPGIIKRIRNKIVECGGVVEFSTRVEALECKQGSCVGVKTGDGRQYAGEVILATGHSARDVYEFLHRQGIRLETKGFAMGVRLEHPQGMIDKIQYHLPSGAESCLPAAEYSFVTQVEGRGVYSFCMCPGGVVVPASSAPGEQVVNGMSASARAGGKANSGMVVQILPEDFEEYADKGVFRLLELQKNLEKKFYLESDCTLNAPAQRMNDFVEGRMSDTLPRTSYAPGIHPARLDLLLPPFISQRLQQGFKDFNKRRKGFLTNEAVLIGLESRTSSPLRIPRNKEDMQHPELPGLYPAGEGAGFAGGIVSAAIDGRRCVDAFALKHGRLFETAESRSYKE